MFAVLPLIILITTILVVSRVAGVALEATGMARDSAHFQARSALMGVGYTTSEAEDITSHPVRRRIFLNLMTFGNVSVITGVGGLLLTFINTEAAQTLQRSVILVVAVLGLLIAFHTKAANRLIERATRAAIRRFTSLDVRDYAALLRVENDFGLIEMQVQAGEWLADRALASLHLTQEGVIVLGVHRAAGHFVGTPTGETVINAGDSVLAYGRIETLQELATRPEAGGDEMHIEVSESHRQNLPES